MSRGDQATIAADNSYMVNNNAGGGRNSATLSSRGRSGCADQQRKYRSLNELQQHLGEGEVVQPWMLSELDTKEKWAAKRMTYVEIKSIIEKKTRPSKKRVFDRQ